jgi:capsular polysaccharide biosynthesis protein
VQQNRKIQKQQNNIEEIDLMELAFALWKKAWLLAICAILGAALALGYTYNFVTPLYKASVTIYVNNGTEQVAGGSDYISATNLTASQKLVTTYVNILQSNKVLNKVIKQAKLDIDPETLRNMITASSVDDTEMFEVSVSSPYPELSAQLANVIAKVAPDEIAEIIDGSSTKIIDYADIPENPYTPSYKKNTMMGFMLGFVLAAAYVCLATLLDKRIKTEEDLEELFDLPVLGSIPDFEAKLGKGSKYGYGYGYEYSSNSETSGESGDTL